MLADAVPNLLLPLKSNQIKKIHFLLPPPAAAAPSLHAMLLLGSVPLLPVF
jgi:hypothetical protein